MANRRFSRLNEIGCIVCRLYYDLWSEPEIHHIRDGMGIGQRNDNDKTIGLCPLHHRLSHTESFHLARNYFNQTFGTEVKLLEETNRLLEHM